MGVGTLEAGLGGCPARNGAPKPPWSFACVDTVAAPADAPRAWHWTLVHQGAGAAAATLLGWVSRSSLASDSKAICERPIGTRGHVPAPQLQERLGKHLPSSKTHWVGNPPSSPKVFREGGRNSNRNKHAHNSPLWTFHA